MDVDVTIGITINRQSHFSPSFLAHYAMLQKPRATENLVEMGVYIDENRNNIVEKSTGKYIFFLDSDIVLPSDALIRLLSHNLDIVSGLYFNWKFPHTPQAYIEVNGLYKPILEYSGLMEVDAVGAGCLLVKRSVFDSLEKPWFKKTELTEDFYFCRKARERGFKIYLDSTVKCGHLTEVVINEDYFKAAKGLIRRD